MGVHAEAGKLAVVSTSSRQAPVMIGEVDVYGIPRASRIEVRSGRRGQACESEREREQGNDEVDCNLHLSRRQSTRVAQALRRWFLLG
jgi:hypothetical protein